MNSIVDSLLQIRLLKDDDFLKVKETLTRVGVASRNTNTLFQSCHILHKQGKFYIVHFKEMFALDGKPTDFTEEDMGRRNAIARLLEDWGLLEIVNQLQASDPLVLPSQIKILPFKEKSSWTLVQKYNIGKRK